MEMLKPLSDFFTAIEKDGRVGIAHIGIYAALLQCWKQKDCPSPLVVFSYEIMQLAKIASRDTYFRCVKELSDYGYIRYVPSFKRNQGSRIYFNDMS
ncbi:hypothetical protein [Chitinophaga defluvii]|uniref:Helix-turn-helix protein n=1 Tax=Chitinophaga defluvii TaxID=3163343 RepID=A0ABV2T6M7_9BACT